MEIISQDATYWRTLVNQRRSHYQGLTAASFDDDSDGNQQQPQDGSDDEDGQQDDDDDNATENDGETTRNRRQGPVFRQLYGKLAFIYSFILLRIRCRR